MDKPRISEWSELKDIKFNLEVIKHGNYISYECQNIVAFDIETSNGFYFKDTGYAIQFDHEIYNESEEMKNAYDNATPVSLMYVWQMSIESQDGPKVFIGRTWEEFLEFYDMLTLEVRRSLVADVPSSHPTALASDYDTALNTKGGLEMFIYVHNLGFEFQHLRNVPGFNEEFGKYTKRKGKKRYKTFARSKRKPMKTETTRNKVKITWRDSLTLTQKSLAQWTKDLPVAKLKEPKDFYLPIRTPETELTETELHYIYNDVVAMHYGLVEYRNKYGTIGNIPMTQTGEVRRQCVAKVAQKNKEWASLCTNITKALSLEEFQNISDLYVGGYTHANAIYTGDIYENVSSYDIASSYPASMVGYTYPVDMFLPADFSEYEGLMAQDLKSPDLKYHFYVKARLTNVRTKLHNTFWSMSKCLDSENIVADNGKIFSADSITVVMSDLDWKLMFECYDFEFELLELRKSRADFLPLELILLILKYYGEKTELKDVEGKQIEYNESKQFINSIYGVSVTRTIDDEVHFDGDWGEVELDELMYYEQIDSTSEDKTFLSFQIGCWVTAYSRNALWEMITKLDAYVMYCDTDSIKGAFNEEQKALFDEYNEKIKERHSQVASILGIDENLFHPKTPAGVEKRVGVYEEEETCHRFKTLGAKRYAAEYLRDGEITIELTVAGLPKNAGPAKVKRLEDFKDETFFNTRESMKNTAYYNDKQPENIVWVDREFNEYVSSDKYGICIKPTTFDLSISEEYESFLELLLFGESNGISEVSKLFL